MINENGGNMPDAIGIPEDMLREAATHGSLQDQYRLRPASRYDRYHPQALRMSNPAHFDPRQYLGPARTAIKEMVAHKLINVLGCNGKA